MDDSLHRGRQAFGQRAWREAYASLSAADSNTPLEGHDLEMLACSAYLIGADDASEAAWTRAYDWLRGRDKRRAARCAFWLVLQLLAVGNWARGGGWLAAAERLLDGEPDCPERGLLHVLMARTHAKQGNVAAAYETFTRVADLARRIDDPELSAFALLGLAQASASRGESAAAMSLFDEAMVAVTAHALSPISVGVIYCAVIEACYDVLDLARAREWTGALSRWCEAQTDLLPFRGHCLVHRAETMRLTGDWAGAISEARQVCAVAVDPAATASLAARVDPAPFDPFALLELVKGRVERGEVEGERTSGPLLDQLRQLVTVPRLVVEEGQDDDLRRSLLRFADGAGEFHRAGLYSGVQNIVNRAVRCASTSAACLLMAPAGGRCMGGRLSRFGAGRPSWSWCPDAGNAAFR